MKDTRREFKAGDVLRVRAHRSEQGKGISYPAGVYRAAEEGCSGGWDVWNVIGKDGWPCSVYGFSIERVSVK